MKDNKKNYTFPRMSLSFRLMPYYFISLIIFFIFFIINVEIRKTIELNGEIKNYTPIETINSKYEGLIKEIYIKEDQEIKKGDKLFSIRIKDPEKISRENKITYYENYLKNKKKYSKKNEEEIIKIKEKLEALKSINNIRIQYSEIEGIAYYKNIKKNKKVKENEEVIQIKEPSIKNIFFVETYVNLEEFMKIKENDLVLIKFPYDNNYLYTSYVYKKYDSFITKKDDKFKITILLNYYPEEIKENINVKIKILKEKVSIYNWIKERINGNI